MRVLVTGASGFIGEAVLKNISEDLNRHEVLCLSRHKIEEYYLNHPKFIWKEFSMEEFQASKKIIDDFRPEALVHLAWEGIPNFSLEKCSKNLSLSMHFLQYILSKKTIKKVIVSGSCFEYSKKSGACNENDETIAKDYFTWSKLSLLNFLRMEAERNKKDFAWLRIFYAYGNKQRKESLIPMLIDKLKNKTIPDIKTPLNANDFVYIDDLGRAFVSCLNLDFKSGIYNLGTGSATSVLDVCKTVEDILYEDNSMSKILQERTSNTIGDSSFFASTDAAKIELGWQSKVTLRQGILNILSDK